MKTFNNAPSVKDQLINTMFPLIGEKNPANKTPIYDPINKCFNTDQYQSEQGFLYFKRVRFSECMAMVEKIGFYHNWEYLDAIELYRYNGSKMEMISEKKFNKQFYNRTLAQETATTLLSSFIKENAEINNHILSKGEADEMAKSEIEKTDKMKDLITSEKRDLYMKQILNPEQ